MYDFNKVNAVAKLTPEWVLSKVDQYAIFLYYYGQFEPNKLHCSKLRRDKNPSAIIKINKSGKLIYNDYASSERLNCFELVKKLYNCNFNECLTQIAVDFGLIERSTRKVPEKLIEEANELDKAEKSRSLIQFVPDKWTKQNLLFWQLFEIEQWELERDNIYPCKQVFLNKNEIFGEEMRYAFPLFEGGKVQGVKIYSPYDNKLKWLSSIPNSMPFLDNFDWNSGAETCIISKGKKDAILLRRFFQNVIVVQNESEQSFPEELQQRCLNTFKKNIILFDSDPPGVTACKVFNDKGFGYFNTPKGDYLKYGIKDVADYVKVFGTEAFKQLLITKGLI